MLEGTGMTDDNLKIIGSNSIELRVVGMIGTGNNQVGHDIWSAGAQEGWDF